MKVIITGEFWLDLPDCIKLTSIHPGASGVLGSAVREAFKSTPHQVLALSNTRTGDGLVPLDLTNTQEVEKVFTEYKPNCRLKKKEPGVFLILVQG